VERIRILDHTMDSWNAYTDRFGFVPDPMIIRAGEIFINGRAVSNQLGRSDWDVWHALEQNIAGIVDFFDMLVTRNQIPLINYQNTFDYLSGDMPITQFPSDENFCEVEIGDNVYLKIKQGALIKLAELELQRVDAQVANMLQEMDAFRYDWKPRFEVFGSDATVTAASAKLEMLSGPSKELAHFLLGGMIFSGFAQASGTTHFVQPKRARYYLGLTAMPDTIKGLSAQEETSIFRDAETLLNGTRAETWRTGPVPPVLPYLIETVPGPLTAQKLVEAALEFRISPQGVDYVAGVKSIRTDGIRARRLEDIANKERQAALDMLAPYSRLDPEKSASLELKLTSELVGYPGAELKTRLQIPTWLKIWWNDNVPFGGLRKTMRRMWMAENAYTDLAGKLRQIWVAS
jgi:hypothetical protein